MILFGQVDDMTHKSIHDDIARLGTIVGIWAHPDDESWAAAGLMKAAVDNGQRVVCITATDGSAGQTTDPKRLPQKQLANIRRKEIRAALDLIGIKELHWLGYQDGKLPEVKQKDAVNKLVKFMNKIKPDTILTFELEGITGHHDHKTVCQWALAAAKLTSSQPIVYGACETTERYQQFGRRSHEEFNIYLTGRQPFTVSESGSDLVFRLSEKQAQDKLAALKAHHSQTAHFFKSHTGQSYFRELASVECFLRLS